MVNILGLTFKPNVPDVRNTRVIDIVDELKEYGVCVNVSYPNAVPEEVMTEYGIELTPFDSLPEADAIILAVPHREYTDMPREQLTAHLTPQGVLMDVKYALDREEAERAGVTYWSL